MARDIIREEARLIILKELAGQASYSASESALQDVLIPFGIFKPREWVRDEMRWLENMGAAQITVAGSVMVATVTLKGLDHVEHRLIIEGVKRPSPRE